MRFPAAIALLALAVPAIAQRGGGHAGPAGGGGFAGHAGGSASGFSRPSGISGSSSFSHPGNFVRPAQPSPYSGFGKSGFQGNRQPIPTRLPIPNGASRFANGRPAYHLGSASQSRGAATSSSRDGHRDRDKWDARRRSFANWYASIYPTWPVYGYSLLIDPGFYDWGDSDDAANGGANAAPDYPYPYPDSGSGAGYVSPDQTDPQGYPEQLPPWNSAYAGAVAAPASAPSLPEQPLTVVFKGGRAPATIHNYMMTGKLLIDLDAQHYEQIPLDQIDLAATVQANSTAGVAFQVPGASRD